MSSSLHERKYNIILYERDECPKGSSRSARLEGDLNKALTVLSKFDQSIGSHAIKDIYRLGRFSSTIKKPRPLLVKLIQVADAIRILSMRGSVNVAPIIVKPDMSPQERKNEYILLKERWSLIQSGVTRKDIKIRGHRLLVRNKLHGQVTTTDSEVIFNCHKPRSVSSDHNTQTNVPLYATNNMSSPLSQTTAVTSQAALNDTSFPTATQDSPPLSPAPDTRHLNPAPVPEP